MTFWLVSIKRPYRGLRGCKAIENAAESKNPAGITPSGILVLATSYSRTAYRRTTIGAAAFHCRVRNGNGWDPRATVTRVRCRTGGSPLRGEQAETELWRRCRSFKEL